MHCNYPEWRITVVLRALSARATLCAENVHTHMHLDCVEASLVRRWRVHTILERPGLLPCFQFHFCTRINVVKIGQNAINSF